MSKLTDVELAQMISDYIADDTATEPLPNDYLFATAILDRIHGKHGYALIFRRALGTLIIGVLALILVLTAHPWSAS